MSRMGLQGGRGGTVAIAFDDQWIFGFDDLDRVVREIDDGARRSVDPILGRSPAPRPKQEFQKDERPPFAIVATKADPSVAAHFAGEHSIGRDLGKRAEQRVGNAKAGQAARRDRGGHYRIDDRGGRRDDLDRPKVAFVVRRVAAAQLLARAGAGQGQLEQIDRALFRARLRGLPSGENVFAVVTTDAGGTRNLQRLPVTLP